HLAAQLVGELQRVGEQVLVHGNQGWRESGRVATRQRVVVVRCREHQYVLEVGVLDGPLQLLAARKLLQALLRHPSDRFTTLHFRTSITHCSARRSTSTSVPPRGPKTSAE